MKNDQQNKRGFTFVELIIVVGVIAVALPALFSILFIVIRQQVKIYYLSEVKRQGDYALNIIENTIRNSGQKIVDGNGNDLCTTANSTGSISTFRDRYNNTFSFSVPLGTTKISSSSSILAGGSVDLTSNKVRVTNFSIICSRTEEFSTPLVSVSFDVSQASAAGITPNPNESASLEYRTKIKLKTY